MKLFYPTVRLVDGGYEGDLAFQGQVEVFYNGIWGRVCASGWDLQDANVVCRQLGFAGAVEATASGAFRRPTKWLSGVQCTGDESSLIECSKTGWGTYFCSQYKYAGVVCSAGDKKYIMFCCSLVYIVCIS